MENNREYKTYGHETKRAWGKTYYSFDQGRNWKTTKAEAFSVANPDYLLTRHVITDPEAYRLAAIERTNANRRARHQAMKDLGLTRVRGAMGGVYYE